jgi:hypothetical protein
MSGWKQVVLATKSSQLRWLILILIVACAFSADYWLTRDISGQVRSAWVDACEESITRQVCEERSQSHHSGCFDLAYTSMIFSLGRARWESFMLIDYESCMNHDDGIDSLSTVDKEQGAI